ncbi:ThiF family adenylyltransferase [Cellulosimicrobium sp. CUA-896]|uniref:ThiF family adenylyltransferase n=1 Tax=Cellulosimicrobium sp. CUA-896 TaxID=1517881 RepID=UPI00210145A2|nr:ThiF family adenylyltransferase [Cellulosimicrobium sp. CUA-896]
MPGRRVLRPSTPVLRRAPGEVQYGTDPRWAVRLVGLDAAEEAWLRTVSGPVRAASEHPAVPAERRARLVQVLEDALLLVPAPPRRATTTAPGGGEADLGVLAALRPDGAGHRVLAARARSAVAVVGLGRLGATLATTLATAGVGSVGLHDPSPVLVTDVGLGAYRVRDVGAPRETALARAIDEISPDVRTGAAAASARRAGAAAEPPDVVVVVEHHAADPARVRELVGDGVAHLSVVVREADVVVGPFVRPGLDPCLTCVDLHRADVDPCWPQVARQLRELAAPQHEESVLAGAAASLAAAQVLAALDGTVPRTTAACLEIPAPDAVPRLRGTSRHPRCGCAGPASAAPDGTPLAARTSGGRGRG